MRSQVPAATLATVNWKDCARLDRPDAIPASVDGFRAAIAGHLW